MVEQRRNQIAQHVCILKHSCLYPKEVYEPTFRTEHNSVYPSYYYTPYSDEKERYPTSEYEEDYIVVPEKFKQIFGLLTVDHGATTTLTRSLFSMSDVERMVVKIHLAAKGMHINSSHVGYETYYVRVATGSIQPVTTKAFYFPGLEQDLPSLGGRALIKEKFRIILSDDPSISGIFPVIDGQIYLATGFPFVQMQPGSGYATY